MKLLQSPFRGYLVLGLLTLLLNTYSISIYAQECITSPVISCPSIFYGCTGDDLSPEALGFATAIAGDANCPQPVVSYSDVTTSTDLCGAGMIIKRFWKATYANDVNPWLFAECTQILVLTDDDAPIITNCPPSVVVGTDSNCRAIVRWDEPSATDDCGILGFTSNFGSGSAFFPGVTTVTYTATDNCGRMTTCSFTVTVQEACCNDTPSLFVPADYTGCPGSSIDPSITGTATATISGFGCGNATITFSDQIINNNTCNQEIRRTWTAVNPNNTNAMSSGTQTIRMRDNNSPVISGCPADFSIVSNANCMAVVTWPTPVATDNCGVQSFSGTHTSGSSFAAGTTTVIYTAIDLCGNTSTCSFNITVLSACCDGVPTLQLPPNYSGCPGSSIDPSITGVAVGTISGVGCSAASITFSDEVITDVDCGGLIRRTWTATNPNFTNQATSAIQLISLEDNSVPVISNCPADITVASNADCIAIVNFLEPTASDNCNMLSFFSDRPTGSGSRFELGTTTITYTAIDGCGNSAICSFDVTVVGQCCDDEMIITCPADFTGCPDTSIDPLVTGTATSNGTVDCPVTLTYFDQIVSQGDCDGTRTIDRYWIGSKDGGVERDTCTQRITLVDTQPPVISSCVPNVTLSFADRTYTWADPVVTDHCSASITYSTPKGTTFSVGSTNVVVTVTDNCGNTVICQFQVTVLPQNTGSGLIVTCPDDIILSCGSSESGRVPVPDVTSDCDLCQEGTIPGFVYMGSRKGHKYYCSRDKMTWPDAQAFCVASGGVLAVINDAGENAFLANKLQASRAYIGLSDHANEGVFQWVDGSPITYNNWYPQQPNNYQNRQDYVEMLRSGLWNDQYNDKQLEFVMEVSCVTITQTSGPQYLSDVTANTTVSFNISDACGDVETCSYQILVNEGDVSLTCPGDIETTTSQNQTVVYFDPPVYQTCCSNCSHGQNIPDFVYMGTLNGSYYYCSTNRDTWHNANKTARFNGGHLAIIDDAGENTFLKNKLVNTIAFIGVSDHAQEGVWRNVNGGTQQYFNWRSDNPNNFGGNQHYVELEPTGRWNDNTGSYKREYIIEIEGCGNVKQTGGIPSGGFFPKGSTTKNSFEATDACGNSRTCSFDVEVNAGSNVQPDYCNSYGENSRRAFIKKVQIGNFTHATGDNGGYYNYDDHCVALTPGSKFRLTVTPGWGSYRYYAYYKMYVDYNGNGTFTDPGEYIGKSRSPNTVSGLIEVPANAVAGLTKMRIVMSLTGYPDPCGSNYYGETEDYCINIGGVTGVPKGIKSKSNEIEVVILDEVSSIADKSYTAVFPNPTSNYFKLLSDEHISKLSMIGMDGRVIRNITKPSGQIDVSDISPGIYILRMIDDAGLEIIEKVVIE